MKNIYYHNQPQTVILGRLVYLFALTSLNTRCLTMPLQKRQRDIVVGVEERKRAAKKRVFISNIAQSLYSPISWLKTHTRCHTQVQPQALTAFAKYALTLLLLTEISLG